MHEWSLSSNVRELIDELLDKQVESWDAHSAIPIGVLRKLSSAGILCPQVPAKFGSGLGYGSQATGELTAYVGSICSSVRSIMTSQGMAAWMIQRLGDPEQRIEHLSALTTGSLAAVAFSEVGAGSDLSAISTEVRRDGEDIVLNGEKVWTTGALYADSLMVVGRSRENEAAAVIVPAKAEGVHVEPIESSLGCRAAGHANIKLDNVRLPAANILGRCSHAMSVLSTISLTFGRLSVAWGCVGIIRGCLAAAATHAQYRHQFGRPIADYQLVLRHLAQLAALESISTQACENASRNWDSRSPSVAFDTVLAKYVSSRAAANGASRAVQLLASAGVHDQHLVARAYRDAKLMEIIEGSNEICEILLAEDVLDLVGKRRTNL